MKDSDFKAEVTGAIDKLEIQGVLSKYILEGKTNCLYGGAGEKCCIVGHMMPKKLRIRADKRLEAGGDSSIELLVNVWGYKEWSSKFNPSQTAFMTKLQKIHDEGENSFKYVISSMRKLVEKVL